ncbi:hypothetical protein, partial [Micromonospora sp. NPDC002575]|uniref:hypothetical protein n=1 Tax=Micromonospora sp. NPDC002575 TaxID=3364222 RepID=UPI0036CAC64E
MSVGFVGGQAQASGLAAPGADIETLDLVGDLRRPVVWPARAGSVSQVVGWPAGVAGSGVVVVAGLVGVLARYTGQSE